MADFTFNPYPEIGTQLVAGLDAISATAPPISTVDQLVNAVYNFIQPIYYPAPSSGVVPKQIEIEIKSVAYNMINAYNNKSLGISVGNRIGYSTQQSRLIGLLINGIIPQVTPINALNAWFLDVEDNISKANLSIDAQTPLLLTTTSAKSIYAYWNSKVTTPGTWAPFFQTAAPLNYANIPFWTEACIEGCLLGANASQKGLIAPTTDIVSVNIISALIGALTIGAGKVIFKWVPRIQPRQLMTLMASPIKNPRNNPIGTPDLAKNDNSGGGTTSPTYDSWNCIVDSATDYLNDNGTCGDYIVVALPY